MLRSKKRIMKTLAFLVTAGTLAASSAVPASAEAGAFRNGVRRGINYLCYVETDVFWNVDWRHNITESSAYQFTRGINVSAGGVHRIETHPLEHVWDAITESTAGLSYKGFGFGWVHAIRDRIHLFNHDYMRVEYNI